ncbi:MAG: protein-glutamate O-methyltransferase CheR [Alphaproteobacteria bacterium]|nr:protein-glutamate O-methyltransferase CheR [Alphaproteobacteria bacterium]
MTEGQQTNSASGEGAIIITDDDLEKFCEFLYRKTGIRIESKKRYFLERRLIERVGVMKCANFRDYFSLLHFEDAGRELQQVVNLMTINETYFFREMYQIDCLINSILADVSRRKRRQGDRLKIWSVPCSTGEEPYSIAISLLERWPLVDDFEIEIHDSDIDSSVLERAKVGVYDERALHLLPMMYRQKYFTPRSDGNWQIISDLRGSIDFTLVNISNLSHTWQYRDFDVIFCRNLLIYFDDVSRRQAAEMFYEALSPGGFICLGHSESMSRMSSLFVPRKFADAMVYQKSPQRL